MTSHAAMLVARLLETTAAEIDKAAAQTDTAPTGAEKKSGKYKKGCITIHGLIIEIETAKGETRSGTDENGKAWSVEMPAHYGEIVGLDT